MRKHRMRKATVGIINWMNCIWLTDLPSNAKYLSCYLRKFMNDNQDMAWPSYVRMIEETGLSRATIAKYLKLLEDEGWIQRERENGENTTYIAKLPKALELGVKNLDSSLGELVQQLNGGSLTDELPLVQQLNTNKQVNKQGSKQDNIDRSFEIFWQAGMRKVNKSGAIKSFKKAFNDSEYKCADLFANALANDVRARVENMQFGFDKMHPTTYLNQKRWNDEYAADKQSTNATGRKSAAEEYKEKLRSQQCDGGLGGSAGQPNGLGSNHDAGSVRQEVASSQRTAIDLEAEDWNDVSRPG